jgi:glycosyltransferase involved in cell wall biosynthesis
MSIENPDISLVVPLFDEEESLRELKQWIDVVLEGRTYEVIFIDDGSRDTSWQVIQDMAENDPEHVVAIKMARNYGKSAGLHTGFQAAMGKVVITMDADLQDSPEEIPELERKIIGEGYDMVSGWKKKRHDPLSKTIPTRLYNAATRMVSGIQLNDFNCGLKAYRLEVVKAIEVQGEMHRYIPILVKNAGFDRIAEQVVQHQARKYGSTKFGLERFMNGFLDFVDHWFHVAFWSKTHAFFRSIRSTNVYHQFRWFQLDCLGEVVHHCAGRPLSQYHRDLSVLRFSYGDDYGASVFSSWIHCGDVISQ